MTCKNGHGGEDALVGKRTKKSKRVTEDDYMELSALLNSHARTWFTDFVNATCIKCSIPSLRMIMVGPIFFCPTCFLEEFEFREEKSIPTYRKWYDKNLERLMKKDLLPILKGR
jgi:hypothetical protein